MVQFYTKLQVLHIEDDHQVTMVVERLLQSVTYADVTLKAASDLQTGLRLLSAGTWDVILLDLGLPDSAGITTFRRVYDTTDLPIVVLTAEASFERRIDVVAAGAQDCIYKLELNPDVLVRALRYAVERHRITQELRSTLRDVTAARNELEEMCSKH